MNIYIFFQMSAYQKYLLKIHIQLQMETMKKYFQLIYAVNILSQITHKYIV